jgi:hypothetical protein
MDPSVEATGVVVSFIRILSQMAAVLPDRAAT